MPNIPPLVTAMPDNQPLFASYTNDTPADPVLMNYACDPIPCTGTGALNAGVANTLFTGVVRYNFGTNYWQPLAFADAGFSYTSTQTTGTIAFSLKFGGAVVQTITQTPSGSAQLVNFDQFIKMLPAVTGAGTYVVEVSCNPSLAQTITATNIVSLYGAVLGCVHSA
jgi:hypothetical protein